MQQNYGNILGIDKLYEAISTYQAALSLLMMKLHSNPILPEIHNNIITRFFSESSELLIEKINQVFAKSNKSYNPLNTFHDSYNHMLNLANDSFTAWQRSTSDFILGFLPKPAKNSLNYQQEILEHFQSYNIEILKIIEENVCRTLDDFIIDDGTKPTVHFLWNEFKKLFNHKNLPILNREVINNPESFLRGAQLFLDDVKSSPNGYLLINTVDRSAFALGKNIAATKGNIVFCNELIELICYENTTENIHKTPILIVTAWINKYYILDLDPQYSYVRWLVDNGYRVFMISWVNPDEKLVNKSLTDYLQDGLLTGINNVKQIANIDEVNCIGYCMGGTLLSIASAYLSGRGEKGIKSITLLTTLTDFDRCGPVKMFITDEMINSIEKHMEKQGYISGYDMFNTFSIIKSNDMIWYYFINKYVLGKEPKAIDVLYWNSDSTRIPYSLHKQCLRDLYQNNFLPKGELTLNNTPINLGNVKCPVYCFATEDDHIAPWESVYNGFGLFNSSNKRFILSKSGHVAAVINHPAKNKYGYWFDKNDPKKSKKFNDVPKQWMEEAQYKDGSWWDDWNQWMIASNLNGENIKTQPIPEDRLLSAAPGSYVKIR